MIHFKYAFTSKMGFAFMGFIYICLCEIYKYPHVSRQDTFYLVSKDAQRNLDPYKDLLFHRNRD